VVKIRAQIRQGNVSNGEIDRSGLIYPDDLKTSPKYRSGKRPIHA